jgi:phosphomannomutase
VKIYLFDIDGTLTPARQPMSKDFAEFFADFCKKNVVYLCTGSDWDKVQEQVPPKVLNRCKGTFACSGNEYWDRRAEDVYVRGNYKSFEPPPELLPDLRCLLEGSECPVKTSNHIEERTGMINFSVVGRDCTQEQRKEYAAWDKENGEREKICSVLRKKYELLSFNIGGQISIDISPEGNDKSGAILDIREWHEDARIHFFGDKLQPGGNDYPVLKELTEKDSYNQVKNYEDTWELLKDEDPVKKVETNAEALKPKPSVKLAPRGIETFTICRQSDESGISGTGVVIEGVEYATGQVVLHWLSPFPKGSIAIFESIEDFKRVHVNPHPTNKTIITWADGRQDEF